MFSLFGEHALPACEGIEFSVDAPEKGCPFVEQSEDVVLELAHRFFLVHLCPGPRIPPQCGQVV